MKHWSVKLIALILVVVSAFTLAVAGFSVAYNWSYGQYEKTLEKRLEEVTYEELFSYCYTGTRMVARQYLRDTRTTENSTARELWESYIQEWHFDDGLWPECEYRIYDEDGTVLRSTAKATAYENLSQATQMVEVSDGQVVRLGVANKEFPTHDNLPLDYQWTDYYGNELPALDPRTVYYDIVQQGQVLYRVERFGESRYRVELLLTQSDLDVLVEEMDEVAVIRMTYALQDYDIPATVISAVVLILCVIFLWCVSGKKTDGTVEPKGTNLLPLDLFAAVVMVGGVGCMAGCYNALTHLEYLQKTMENALIWYGLYGAFAAGAALMVTLFFMAFFAQIRMGRGAWYKRSLMGGLGEWIIRQSWKLIRRFWGKMKKFWNWACEKLNLLKYLRIFGQILKKLWGLMDMTWQWVIAYGALLVLTAWVAETFMYHNGWAFFVVAVFGFTLVAYTGFAFGRLRKAAKRMSEGDLDSKIDTYEEFLFGHFAEFAEDLNTLSDTCIDAAMEKMKSERMKTELITNVSHDIKTPLTSVINYVDLLKKAQTEEERQEYLEVLDRQSLRLKKLIEDLMEMSKASTGNISVELSQTDVVEAVNQALGEFADRLEGLELNVVFRQKDQSVFANCDGKLLWRVLSNLLVNVVKYTMPGTRLYVDVTQDERKVYISLKNISKEPLNIPAEELMERFVRGDESRTDQGNGLGLNIAKGLMEVQQGDLELTVDGDLFKATLMLNR